MTEQNCATAPTNNGATSQMCWVGVGILEGGGEGGIGAPIVEGEAILP
jgi:hypothetical protein